MAAKSDNYGEGGVKQNHIQKPKTDTMINFCTHLPNILKTSYNKFHGYLFTGL